MNASLRATMLAASLATACATPLARADIVFFTGTNMSGDQFALHVPTPNFDNGPYNDRARSAYVRDGAWLVCTDANFQGDCQTLGPGSYATLEHGLDRNISSARPVGGGYAQPQGGYGQPQGAQGGYNAPPPPPGAYPPPQGGYNQGYAPAPGAVLYEQPGFGGRAFPINRERIGNFDRTQFNDRAQSLRIAYGYWIFCSDADFQGNCRTFGPGDYPSLEWSLNRSISSGRMISNDYPYNQQPNWR